MKITGNTIAIIGGTSGIGRALAVALHEKGNQVIVAGRRQELLDQVTAERPCMAGIVLDLDDASSLERFSREIRQRFPALNVVLANAGISRSEDMTGDDWNADLAEEIVQTNILGVIRIAAALLPVLKQQAHSTFIATSSNLAFIPRADFPTYCASKAFLHSWLQSLRHQLRELPVEVLELSPPYVATELTGPQQAVDPRAIPIDTYVTEVMAILESGDHPRGEILVKHDQGRRWAEREGRYDEVYAAMNPA